MACSWFDVKSFLLPEVWAGNFCLAFTALLIVNIIISFSRR